MKFLAAIALLFGMSASAMTSNSWKFEAKLIKFDEKTATVVHNNHRFLVPRKALKGSRLLVGHKVEVRMSSAELEKAWVRPKSADQ